MVEVPKWLVILSEVGYSGIDTSMAFYVSFSVYPGGYFRDFRLEVYKESVEIRILCIQAMDPLQ
jgi:hypothetical protein